FLRELNAQGTTIILTTHYLEEAESLCRNIAIIDRGEIIENTGVKALLRRLQAETFLLDLTADLPGDFRLEGYDSRVVDARTLEVTVQKTEPLNRLFEMLSARGLQVSSMRNKANRLEELFVSLLRQNQPEAAA
ncbi:MAG: ABC transporter ATP-binding protein, partial [Gammaproteobacteria bacterium]